MGTKCRREGCDERLEGVDEEIRFAGYCTNFCREVDSPYPALPAPPLPARGLLGGITETPTGDTTDRAVSACAPEYTWRLKGTNASLTGDPTDPVLPTDPEVRKQIPLFSGVLNYFPLALAAVARHSKRGNDKHNPGEPLHWSRGKSNDHADCIARHLIDIETVHETTGEYEEAQALAWRALAKLQELEEGRLGKPPSRGSKVAVRADAALVVEPSRHYCGAV